MKLPGDKGWMAEMFSALDRDGVPGLFPWLHEDLRFRFAGYPAGQGAAEFAAAWEAMSGSIQDFRHSLEQCWDLEDRAICQGEVCYFLRDGREIRAPFVNIFHLRDGRISEYLIYVDASAVLGPAPG